MGYLACGGFAMGWLAASGGAAVAHDFAVGATAFARHANDETARAFLHSNGFFIYASALLNSAMLLTWLPMGLVLWQISRMRRRASLTTKSSGVVQS